MPDQPIKRSEQAFQETRLKVAAQTLISRKADLLDGGYMNAGDNTDKLAEELMTKGTWKGKKLGDYPPEVQKNLGNIMTAANGIAGHVRDTVQEQEDEASIGGASMGQIFRGFTDNPMGFIGALLSGLMGLFTGQGMEGFSKALAPFVAPQVVGDVEASLRDRLEKDGDLKGLGVGGAEIVQVVATVGNKAREQGGLPAVAEPVILPKAEVTRVLERRLKIRQSIDESFGLKSEGGKTVRDPRVEATGNARKLALLEEANRKKFTDDQLGALSHTMTQAIDKVISGDAKATTPEQIRDYIKGQLEANKKETGIDNADLQRLIANQATSGLLADRITAMDAPETKEFNKNAAKEYLEIKKNSVSRIANAMVQESLSKSFAPGTPQANAIALMRGGVPNEKQQGMIVSAITNSITPIILDEGKAKSLSSEQLYSMIKSNIEANLSRSDTVSKINSASDGFVVTPDLAPVIAAQAAKEAVRSLKGDPDFNPKGSSLDMEQQKKNLRTILFSKTRKVITDEADKKQADSYLPAFVTNRARPSDDEIGYISGLVTNATSDLVFKNGKYEGKAFSELSSEDRVKALQTAIYDKLSDADIAGSAITDAARSEIAERAAKQIVSEAREMSFNVAPAPVRPSTPTAAYVPVAQPQQPVASAGR